MCGAQVIDEGGTSVRCDVVWYAKAADSAIEECLSTGGGICICHGDHLRPSGGTVDEDEEPSFLLLKEGGDRQFPR